MKVKTWPAAGDRLCSTDCLTYSYSPSAHASARRQRYCSSARGWLSVRCRSSWAIDICRQRRFLICVGLARRRGPVMRCPCRNHLGGCSMSSSSSNDDNHQELQGLQVGLTGLAVPDLLIYTALRTEVMAGDLAGVRMVVETHLLHPRHRPDALSSRSCSTFKVTTRIPRSCITSQNVARGSSPSIRRILFSATPALRAIHPVCRVAVEPGWRAVQCGRPLVFLQGTGRSVAAVGAVH